MSKTKKLTPDQWVDYLIKYPDDFAECPFEDFKSKQWVSLLIKQNSFHEICPFPTISPNYLPVLILMQPKLHIYVDLNLIGDKQWKMVQFVHPELSQFRTKSGT